MNLRNPTDAELLSMLTIERPVVVTHYCASLDDLMNSVEIAVCYLTFRFGNDAARRWQCVEVLRCAIAAYTAFADLEELTPDELSQLPIGREQIDVSVRQ